LCSGPRADDYADVSSSTPLPIIVLGPVGYTQVMKPDGLRGAKPDPMMRKLKGASHQNNVPVGSSTHYRSIYTPIDKHFDRKHAAEPEWMDNPRRFLLVGRPQIGKTGVFLWLSWLLWKQLNNTAVDAAPAVPVDLSHPL